MRRLLTVACLLLVVWAVSAQSRPSAIPERTYPDQLNGEQWIAWPLERKADFVAGFMAGHQALSARIEHMMLGDAADVDPLRLLRGILDPYATLSVSETVTRIDEYYAQSENRPFRVVDALYVVVGADWWNSGPSQSRVPSSYEADMPILAWSEQVGELRGSTSDTVRTTYIVEPVLGYDGENNDLVNELILRKTQIIDMFNDYFSSRPSAELNGPTNKAHVEQALLDQINRLLRNGQIQDIVWGCYQFLPY